MSLKGPAEVRVPRALQHYRCERTLMCCKDPFVAPVDEEDEARLRSALAQSEAGRELLPHLGETISGEGAQRAWLQLSDGGCAHLDREERGCRIHRVAGLQALPGACRNFPRIVHAVDDRWDVTFSLSCPTAARLLTEDAEPYTMVSRPVSGFGWGPALARTSEPARDALVDGWMALLHAAHADAAQLVNVIGAMLTHPEAPGLDATIADDVQRGIDAVLVYFAAQRLAQLPERGPLYEAEQDTLVRELAATWSTSRIVAAADAAPELVAVLVSHELQRVSMHPEQPAGAVVWVAARRGLMALRVVDALCDQVPLRTRQLFADAYTIVAMLGVAATVTG